MKTQLRTHLVPALKDNYAYIVEDLNTAQALVIDPSEFGPVSDKLNELNLKPTAILNTHHHHDHIGGNLELKQLHSCPIFCSAFDQSRIAGADRGFHDGETFSFADDIVRILEIPGHTLGHVAFYFEKSEFLFCGDTLFSAGCGRLFEGTAEQMFSSLQKLLSLPETAQIFCGHEYTVSNLQFAQTIESQNLEVAHSLKKTQALRALNQPTLPSTLKIEKQINVFLRAPNAQKFAQLRKIKDEF
jgi:hydroxyacylglutathione hydrolase